MQDIQFYNEGDQLYADMLVAIEAATVSINIESYIFADDIIGQTFIQQLINKAKQGIAVRLVLDSVGSNRWRNSKYFKKLSCKGIKIHWFNPWSWRDPLKFNRRNHRKVMIIDHQLCFMGGFNFHQESSLKHFGQQRWKDAHICFKGAISQQLDKQFNLVFKGRSSRLQSIISNNGLSKILPNYSRKCQRQLRQQYIQQIGAAKQSVLVTTPYFVPDSKMLKVLQKAALKGIKVTIIVPKYNDHQLLKYAAYWYYRQLLACGIEIFEFTERMLHSKMILIDQNIAVVGSANMDYRSLFINSEVMLFSHEKELVHCVSQEISTIIKQSEQVSVKQISFSSHFSFLYTMLGYLLRKWL
jgi:cardiolipin synthase A/B